MERYDLAIIGAGTAGMAAAIRADELGARTALINAGMPLGGTSLHWGCIPSKHLIFVARALQAAEQPPFAAVQSGRVRLDLEQLREGKDNLVRHLREHKYANVLDGLANVRLLDGWARLVGAKELDISGKQVFAERVIVASGASPRVPPFEGLDRVSYLTYREALALEHIPLTLLVVGAGPTGLELAQLYSRLGSVVTVLERGPRILPQQEPAVSEALRQAFEDENIEVHNGAAVKRVVGKDRRIRLEASFGERSRALEAEAILMATGQSGNTQRLGLAGIGVSIDRRGFVSVDDYMESSVPGIYAAGDVTGDPGLDTAAAMQGRLAAENALGTTRRKLDLAALPLGVFTSPEVASVGLTEEACREIHGDSRARVVPMSEVPLAVATGATRGFLKLVATPEGKVVGVHIICERAIESIQTAALAIRQGLTIDDLVRMPHVYPSFTQAIKLAAQSFHRSVESMACCIG
ncbi:MAG: mercury(II) reductase [Pseudomonadota bacterium]